MSELRESNHDNDLDATHVSIESPECEIGEVFVVAFSVDLDLSGPRRAINKRPLQTPLFALKMQKGHERNLLYILM